MTTDRIKNLKINLESKDITKLKWTKNIKVLYKEHGKWAASNVGEHFNLVWRNKDNKDEKNAEEPQEGELILLRQRGRITHIVELLDSQVSYSTTARDEFNIYRHVEVFWITDNWENPPSTDKLFAHGINFPANGKVHQLENLKAFKHRWEKEGLPAFQREVQKVLNIY